MRTYGHSLHFCPLLDLLVAFAIGWLLLATREADTSAGGEGWPPRRRERVAEVRQESYDEVGG